MKKKSSPIARILIGSIMALAGLGIFFKLALPDYLDARRSADWPKVTGIVLKSKIIEGTRVVENKKKRTSKTVKTFRPHIVYEYEVNERTYKKSSVYYGNLSVTSSSKSSASGLINKYPVDKEITVYYSPEGISESVLEPGAHMRHSMFALGSFVVGLIGVFITGLPYLLTIFFVIAGTKAQEKKRKTSISKKRKKSKRKNPIQSDEEDIDLDDEMNNFNNVSHTSLSPADSPDEYSWLIKGKGKDHGPFSYERVVEFYKAGKINGKNKCVSTAGGPTIFISEIIDEDKMAS